MLSSQNNTLNNQYKQVQVLIHENKLMFEKNEQQKKEIE